MSIQPRAKKTDERRTPRRVFRRPVGLLCDGKYQVVMALQVSEGGIVVMAPVGLGEKREAVVSFCLPGGFVVVARTVIAEIEKLPADSKSKSSTDSASRDLRHMLNFKPLSLQVRRSIRNYVTGKTQAEAESEGEGDSASAVKAG